MARPLGRRVDEILAEFEAGKKEQGSSELRDPKELLALLFALRGGKVAKEALGRLLLWMRARPSSNQQADTPPSSSATRPDTQPVPSAPQQGASNATSKEIARGAGELAREMINRRDDSERPTPQNDSDQNPAIGVNGKSKGPVINDENHYDDAQDDLEDEKGALNPIAELRKSALRQLPEAAALKGDELGNTADIKRLRQSAREYMRKNFIESGLKVINDQTGIEIEFNKTGLDKTVSSRRRFA